jgi:hypothetical protein
MSRRASAGRGIARPRDTMACMDVQTTHFRTGDAHDGRKADDLRVGQISAHQSRPTSALILSLAGGADAEPRMFVVASCQSEPLCPRDGRSTLIDASDHKTISASQMTRRSHGAIPI